jgi:hypothetical protein
VNDMRKLWWAWQAAELKATALRAAQWVHGTRRPLASVRLAELRAARLGSSYASKSGAQGLIPLEEAAAKRDACDARADSVSQDLIPEVRKVKA